MDTKKDDLKTYLSEIIRECSKELKALPINSKDWVWVASKKTLAESILIKFT